MISNIINREFYSINKPISILWTPSESIYFADFIRLVCNPCALVDFDKTFYGTNDIYLIVCNNRLVYLEKCIELAKFFHSPLLIVDHSAKTSMVSSEFRIEIPFQPVYNIALSKDIYFSWNKIHDMIIEYSDNKNTVEKWKNIIYQLIKSKFVMKDNQYVKNQK